MYWHRFRQIFRAAQFPVLQDPELGHFVPSAKIIGELRELPYLDQWRLVIEKKWYHLRLEDHSLFIFNEGQGSPSYSFLHAPVVAETMREFLRNKNLDVTSANARGFAEEYSLVLDTAQLRNHVLPIRFDFDYTGYRAGVHPLAHLHFGLENNVRVAVKKSMSAEAFVLFVMRQMYPECWERLLSQRQSFKLAKSIRTALVALPEKYWSDLDALELHLA
jgi:hypothetical protein